MPISDTAQAVASIVNPMFDETARAAKASMQVAVSTNPDFDAELRRVSERTGVPLDSARAYPDEVKQQAAVESHDYDGMAQQFPNTTRFLANIENARLAHDDVKNLSDTESTIGPIIGPKATFSTYTGGLLTSFTSGAEMARQGVRMQLADLFGFENVRKDAERKYSQASLELEVATPEFESSTTRNIYGGLSSTLRAAPGLAASIATRSAAPSLAAAGLQTEAEAYGKYRIRGATAGQAFVGALGEGGTEVATEMLPMGFLTKNLGRVGAGEFLTGLLAREIPGEQIATLVQDAIDTSIANPDKTWGDYLKERPGAAYATLVATITQSAILGANNSAATRFQVKGIQAEQAVKAGEALAQMNALAEASKVRERDSTTAQSFFQSLLDEGRDTVWIDPQKLADSGMMAQMMDAIPGVSEQIEQAAATRTDIRIPIADLMAKLPGQELAQTVIPHLSEDPGGFTQTTAAQFMESTGARDLAEEVSRVLETQKSDTAFNASRDVVTAGMLEQLNTAGRFAPQVNEAYASMIGNFYAVQAAKLGITPEAMAEKYPLQVRAEQIGGGRQLDQPAAQLVDRVQRPASVASWSQENREAWAKPWESLKRLATDGKITQEDADQVKAIARKGQAGAGQKLADLVKEIKRRPVNELEQADQGERRGAINLAEDITTTPSIISLLQNADLSTFLHESGHFFLEVMNHVASQENAPEGVKQDMETVLKWFGVPDLAAWNALDFEGKRDYHEQFARGFEAYLFEGNAPTSELQGVFSRFRSWLLNVYKSLTALKVDLSDEVRSVFDRMLASNEAIANAEAEQSAIGMFGTKPEFMTDQEWQAYRDLNVERTAEAAHELETRSLKDMQWMANARAGLLAKIQRENAGKRKAMKADVTSEVMAEPVNRARTFFRTGKNPDGTQADVHKISVASMKERYGGYADNEFDPYALLDWSKLGYGKYGILAEDGITPDMAAETFGYISGDAFVSDLLSSPPAKERIEQITDQRMLETYGDLTDQKAIESAIAQAMAGKAHLKFLATELNALQKASGGKAILAKAAKTYAERIVNRTPIEQLRPDQFTAAGKRAALASEKAFRAGDLAEAAAQKQTQLINAYAAAAAVQAKAQVEKISARFKKMTGGKDEAIAKARDMDMVQATRAILAEFGIGARGQKATEYLAKVQEYDPAMARVLRERIDAATENAQPVRKMTVEQYQALSDEVESLWFLAKRSRQMEVDGDLLDRQDVQDQLADRMREIGIPETVAGEGQAITPAEVRLSQLQTAIASLRRVEAWAGARDGSQAMGPFRKFVWNTIKDAADNYRAEKAVRLKDYRALLEGIAPTLKQVKIAAPEISYTFGYEKGGMGKMELLHAILHTGNAGNKKKLLLGRRWAVLNPDGSMDTTNWDSFINRMISDGTLTKADFDFAQGVWDLMESMKPAAQKTHREVFGRYFDEVTADAFDTPWGRYAGGYVPAMADSRIVPDAKTRAILEEQNAAMVNVMPSTSKGFTKSRVEYNKPLLLDLRALSQHIDKVLLFTHMERPVQDVRRILGSGTVSNPLHRIDPAAYDGLLIPWLNHASRQQVEINPSGSNGLMRFFSVVRSRAGTASMFANISNTAQQITGFSMAALKVKPSYLLSGAVDFFKDPKALAESISEVSPYMANRMDNEIGAMTDAINDILVNPNVYQKFQNWSARHTYFMQSAVDNVMGPIIWQGAYNEAMETAPAEMSDSEIKLYARRLADSAVRETQGSTLPEDISRIETGNAFVRLFTQFSGYFNMQANLLGTEFSKVAQEQGLRKGLGRGFYIMLFGFFMPAWVAQSIALAFRGGPDDEDKNGSYLDDWFAQTFGWGTLRAGTALVPVIGPGVNAAANGFNKKPYDDRISTSPAISMIESAVSVPADVYGLASGKDNGAKTARDVATLVTLMTGLPATAVVKPITYATDVSSGKVHPVNTADTARGIITGTASPQSKGR